jgi:Flp pilus assembly protein TadD
VSKPQTITAPALGDSPILGKRFAHWLNSLAVNAADFRVRTGLGVLVIVSLVLVSYLPILPGSFLMDDHRLVKDENPLMTGELTPLNIWFQSDFTLSTFTLWLQWLAWGESPGGYHAVNMMLQAVSAVLLWRLLTQLKIPGAWLAAAVFAVHPVCVNSVARIAEIKNTLSLPFFILSFWFYLRYEKSSLKTAVEKQITGRRWSDHAALWYGFSLATFVLALMSKTTTVMLPLVLLGCASWQRGRITRQDLLHTSPYFLLSLAFGLMSAWFQKHQALAMAGQTLQQESFLQKLAGAGRDFWFYLGKALMPLNLNLVYARWKLDAATLAAFLPVIFLCAVFVFCWWFRRGWGRHVLFGLGCFLITLFPALGFFDSQFLTKWQVSDHLQYLPLIAPVTLAVGGLAFFLNARTFRWAGAALILTLSILTFQRAQVFASEESLFRDAIAKNPAASEAHNDLGVILAKRQNITEAVTHFSAAVQSDTNNANAQSNLGQALALNGDFTGAEPHLMAAIHLNPSDPMAHRRFADALKGQGRNREAVIQLQTALDLSAKPDAETRMDLAEILFQAGDSRHAAEQFRKVISVKPNSPEPLNNLAWILATASDDSVRDGNEAVRNAETACRLTAFKQSAMVSTLAAAYAEAGRFSEAVTAAELAMKLANASGETRFAYINSQLLPLYRAGIAYHERPQANLSR